MTAISLQYDGSFMGLMHLIFEVYERKITPVQIQSEPLGADLFSTQVALNYDEAKAIRVIQGILKKSSKKMMRFLYKCFLSEQEGIELKLLYLIQHVLAGRATILQDYSDPYILDLHQITKSINREVHRMHAFVRFHETKDGIWACDINPDFNVLPLIGTHFKDRYPTLHWLIYDVNRKYGIFHQDGTIEEVSFEHTQNTSKTYAGGLISDAVLTDEEKAFQKMWKQYFKHVNIEERNNQKLHVRHVPVRYWEYLVEKRK